MICKKKMKFSSLRLSNQNLKIFLLLFTDRMHRLGIHSPPTVLTLDFHHYYMIYEFSFEESPALVSNTKKNEQSKYGQFRSRQNVDAQHLP